MASNIQPSFLNGESAPANANDFSSASSASDSPPGQTTAHLTSTEAWKIAFAGDNQLTQDHGGDDGQYDIARDSEAPMALKPEPLDDNFCMDVLKEAPITSNLTADHSSAANPPRVKKPRGRPRKHLVMPTVGAAEKVRRSKTGCHTCRRRKKKCDEAKPRCMNCETNALLCEGYLEKQIWKSGKESLPLIPLRPIFDGLETLEDRIFWRHYNGYLSTVLTVEGDYKSAFKDMMVPITVKHQGLMHSILSLASKHIDFDTPYGINILRDNPNTTLKALRERSIYHHDEARQKFCADCKEPTAEGNGVLISARYGQILCFLLEALVEGNPFGDHRIHLSIYRKLITTSTPNDPAFFSFISEFFEYHIYADELVHSALEPDCQTVSEGTYTHPQIHQPRLLGVADGLLDCLSRTTAIRNMMRRNMLAHTDLAVCWQNVAELDITIRGWVPHWPPGDCRKSVGYIYRQMVYIHLLRTLNPPSPTTAAIMPRPQAERLFEAVECSLALLKGLSPHAPP
ncbi:hypothetical protein B0T21DRAFT_281848 [Apiosordaria backusii]|uniref:Zn(2)-C6 fungal-type domain-containing protein n=1 Tax=Apiosordaria backusii TaxID=314023 RepID=A0AA40ES34_9PEZI|nr:hypothetical protein B0T21DRAFT_281848 [Apiosordaria backusii]